MEVTPQNEIFEKGGECYVLKGLEVFGCYLFSLIYCESLVSVDLQWLSGTHSMWQTIYFICSPKDEHSRSEAVYGMEKVNLSDKLSGLF